MVLICCTVATMMTCHSEQQRIHHCPVASKPLRLCWHASVPPDGFGEYELLKMIPSSHLSAAHHSALSHLLVGCDGFGAYAHRMRPHSLRRRRNAETCYPSDFHSSDAYSPYSRPPHHFDCWQSYPDCCCCQTTSEEPSGELR